MPDCKDMVVDMGRRFDRFTTWTLLAQTATGQRTFWTVVGGAGKVEISPKLLAVNRRERW